MKKWVEIMMPVMLFATVLYFCVFAVLTHRSAQTAAMQPGGTTVVLDAGHGGEDGGATGVSGTSEAALNLDISLRLRDLLRLCGVRVSMIRETDTAVYSDGCRTISEKKVSDIKNRTETVNQTENALLLSVHQNFFTEGKYHGAQVFYAKTPGSQTLAEQLQANLALGLGHPPAVQKIGRRVSHGAYRLHRRAGRMRIFIQLRGRTAALAAGVSEKAGRRDCGNALGLAFRGASE